MDEISISPGVVVYDNKRPVGLIAPPFIINFLAK